MSDGRNGCIVHPPGFPFLQHRPEYLLMTEDSISAKLLSWFEFLTNCRLGLDPQGGVWLGGISASKLRVALIADATEHHIRARLEYLVSEGFLDRRGNQFNATGSDYKLNIAWVQECMDEAIEFLRSKDRGYDLDLLDEVLRSFGKGGLDQKIEALRSKDRSSIYKKYREFKKEKENTPLAPQMGGCSSPVSKSDEYGAPLSGNVSQPQEAIEKPVNPPSSGKAKNSSRRRKIDLTDSQVVAALTPQKLSKSFGSADDLYGMVPSFEYFERLYSAYDRKAKERGGAAGDRRLAAAAFWILMACNFRGYGFKQFTDACRRWVNTRQVGFPHLSVFLFGNQSQGSDPAWMQELGTEQSEETENDPLSMSASETLPIDEVDRRIGQLINRVHRTSSDWVQYLYDSFGVQIVTELAPETRRSVLAQLEASIDASAGERADAELRQHWLPSIAPVTLENILRVRYGTPVYADLTGAQKAGLLTHLKMSEVTNAS